MNTTLPATPSRLRLSVIGTGYVGLVSGACLADVGHEVVCVDIRPERVDAVNAGRSGLHEPGLDALLAEHVPTGRLRATTDLSAAVIESDMTLLAVPTPYDEYAGRIDLQYIEAASASVGRAIGLKWRHEGDYHVVAIKSTCVPGTADDVVTPILAAASGLTAGSDFGVGSNPEFLSEGTAVRDFSRPDRIVIGSADARALGTLERLYAPYVERFGEAVLVRTNARAAEMIKYASNLLLATTISYANQIADICAVTPGVDVTAVMRGVHRSRYLTVHCEGETGQKEPSINRFLMAGCGFGGSCLPKDTKALTSYARSRGVDAPLLEAVTRVNESRPQEMIRLAQSLVGSLRGKRVTVLGTAFKPGTADIRQSPTLPIIEALWAEGMSVTTYDPAANDATAVALGGLVTVADDLPSAVREADLVVVAVAWPHFDDLATVIADVSPSRPIPVLDGRRRLDPAAFDRFAGVGRG